MLNKSFDTLLNKAETKRIEELELAIIGTKTVLNDNCENDEIAYNCLLLMDEYENKIKKVKKNAIRRTFEYARTLIERTLNQQSEIDFNGQDTETSRKLDNIFSVISENELDEKFEDYLWEIGWC